MVLPALAAFAGGATVKAVGAAVGVAGAAASVKDVSDGIAKSSLPASFGVTGIRGTKQEAVTMTPGQSYYAGGASVLNDRLRSLISPKDEPEKSATPSTVKKSVLPISSSKVGGGAKIANASDAWNDISSAPVVRAGFSLTEFIGGLAANANKNRLEREGQSNPWYIPGIDWAALDASRPKFQQQTPQTLADQLINRKVRTTEVDSEGNPVIPWAPRNPFKPSNFVDTTPTIGDRAAPRTAAGWVYGGKNSGNKSFAEFLGGIFSNENATKGAEPTATPDKEYDWQRIIGQPKGLPLLREYNGEDAGIAAYPKAPVIDAFQLGGALEPESPRIFDTAPAARPAVYPFPSRPAALDAPRSASATPSKAAPTPMPGRPASIDRKVAPIPMPAYLADDSRLGRGGADPVSAGTTDAAWFEPPAPLAPASVYDGFGLPPLPSGEIRPGDPDYDPSFTGSQIRISNDTPTTSTTPARTPPAALSTAPWVTGSRGDTPVTGDGDGSLPGPGLGMIDLLNVDWWKQAGVALLVVLIIAALMVYGVRKTLGD